MKPTDRLSALIGEQAAEILCERLGGCNPVYIPATPTPGSRLSLAIGHDAVAKLCRAMPGEYLTLPSRLVVERARRRSAVLYDLAAGLPSSEVAVRNGLTARYVRLIRQIQEL